MLIVKGKKLKGKQVVSIIIPTYNEEKDIEECIRTLLKQNYKDKEIIVVDDGSSDRTVEIVKKFKKVKLIKGEHKGTGFSRNLGARKAKGKILVFVDADMAFPKNYLQLLVKPIINDEKVIGTAEETQIVTNYDNIWSRCLGRYISHPGLKERIIFRAIRKNRFMEMGGFDPKYGYADDKTFWFKYKVKSVIAKNSKCYHKNPETLKELYNQSRWVGSSTDNKFLRASLTKDRKSVV